MKKHLIVFENCRIAEPSVRSYLLGEADVVRLTMVTWRDGILFRKKGGRTDSEFNNQLRLLEDDLIEEEKNNMTNDLMEQPGKIFNHFYYRLSPSLKALLNRQTLLWGEWNWGELYGFEDPTFCIAEPNVRIGTEVRSYLIIGTVISHEPIFRLYLENDTYHRLKRQSLAEWEY